MIQYSISAIRHQPLMSIGEDAIKAVNSILTWCGKACVAVLDTGISIFKTFVQSAYTVLTTDLNNADFSTFWGAVGVIVDVFVQIAATLMVLLFLIGMANDALSNRHEMEIFSIVKDFLKLSIAVVLVEYSKKIVLGIFNAGIVIAKYSFKVTTGSDIADINLSMDDSISAVIKSSVVGLKGLFLFVLFLIGTVILIGTGLMIALEVYQRLFKLFLLIPFSAISFSFFAIGNGTPGNEVFHGYVKNIFSTAIEAVVISICIGFMLLLIKDVGKEGSTMEKLFPSGFKDVNAGYSLEINTGADFNFTVSLNHSSRSFSSNIVKDLFDELSEEEQIELIKAVSWSPTDNNASLLTNASIYMDYENTSKGFKDSFNQVSDMYARILYGDMVPVYKRSDGTILDFDDEDINDLINITSSLEASSIFSNKMDKIPSALGNIISENGGTLYLTYYKKIDFKQALFLLIQYVFPCILGLGAIKQAPQIANMVVGK